MRSMIGAAVLAVIGISVSCAKEAPLPPDYREQVEAFRAKRASEIISPTGWAALVGLHWLTPGTHTIGAAPGSEVRLTGPSAPPSLGTITVTGEGAMLMVTPGVDTRQGGEAVTHVDLRPGSPPEQYVSAGGLTMTLIRRGDRLGLRVWDAQAPTMTSLTGLQWMPIDETWRVEARFEPHPSGRTMKILNVLDELVEMANPGVAVFTVAGHEYRLEALLESKEAKELFFLFRDGTSGKTTYGAGRYLYTPLPENGRVILDFNEAKNPPCAFTDFATCPLPPKGNVLALAINAGELDHKH